MKKLSIFLLMFIVVLVSCKKTPPVNIQYVDVEREVLNIGSTTANIQCDYEYIATLKSAKLYYGRTEDNMNSVTMRVVQSVLYAEISGLSTNTTYKYYYEFENGFNSMKSGVKAFTTLNDGGGCDYVDLCLPSGTLWATCNLGANSPEEYGNYFAWGETEPKAIFTVGNYKYCNGDFYSLTKYCNDPFYGYNGITDNLTVLLAEDDVATVNLGDNWCMPTKEQWQELFDNTDATWTTQNGVFGLLLTTSCNSLFLPAAGHYNGNTVVAQDIEGVGSEGLYWSSLLDMNYPITSWMFSFTSNGGGMGTSFRYSGQSIRPVRKTNTPTPPGNTPEGAINGLFTINANGDQVYFSQGNLQYQASTDTWRFAENQWDYVGGDWLGVIYGNVFVNGVHCANNMISPTYDGWIDLFCWGTSGYNHGAVCYQPWSTSEENSDYYAYGNPTCNLNDQTGQADWGYNAISNGGNTENSWRTLAIDEWHYILFTRTTTTGIRYAKANVCGINGVILFPDNWDSSMYSVNDSNISDVDYSSNTISNSNWVAIFETHGAVFLPVTGTRIYVMAHSFNEGCYWSATYRYYDAINILYFAATYLGTNIDNGHRHDAKSVRLVQNAH